MYSGLQLWAAKWGWMSWAVELGVQWVFEWDFQRGMLHQT